jgi:hypothetical protein
MATVTVVLYKSTIGLLRHHRAKTAQLRAGFHNDFRLKCCRLRFDELNILEIVLNFNFGHVDRVSQCASLSVLFL